MGTCIFWKLYFFFAFMVTRTHSYTFVNPKDNFFFWASRIYCGHNQETNHLNLRLGTLNLIFLFQICKRERNKNRNCHLLTSCIYGGLRWAVGLKVKILEMG